MGNVKQKEIFFIIYVIYSYLYLSIYLFLSCYLSRDGGHNSTSTEQLETAPHYVQVHNIFSNTDQS